MISSITLKRQLNNISKDSSEINGFYVNLM